jgi:hypothetical protein
MGWAGCFPAERSAKTASKQEKQKNAEAETTVRVLSSIGIDIGKDVFHLVGFDSKGKIILRKKIKRLAPAETFKKIPPCIVGMEACLARISSAGAFRVTPSQYKENGALSHVSRRSFYRPAPDRHCAGKPVSGSPRRPQNRQWKRPRTPVSEKSLEYWPR